MDVLSYKLGKNASGGGSSASDYFYETPIAVDTQWYGGVKKVEGLNLTGRTSLTYFFQSAKFETASNLKTTGISNFNGMFSGCNNLINVDKFDTSAATNMVDMLDFPKNINDKSLDNVLQMCIDATSTYEKTKTFASVMGLSSSYRQGFFPASRIQALPHYQNFVDAGWTIGY